MSTLGRHTVCLDRGDIDFSMDFYEGHGEWGHANGDYLLKGRIDTTDRNVIKISVSIWSLHVHKHTFDVLLCNIPDRTRERMAWRVLGLYLEACP